jgi:amidase
VQAIVYPTAIRRAAQSQAYNAHPAGPATGSAANLANLAGLPDLVVPAGWTHDGLPVCLSFLGTAFSEPQLLALGYAFELATHARRQPVHAPALAGESIRVPRESAQA